MKIIVDECLPKRVIHFFTEHEVWTVPQIGFGTIVIRSVSNRYADLERFRETLLKIIKTISPGTIVHIP